MCVRHTAWGDNTFGQLGEGTFDTSPAPVVVSRSDALLDEEVARLVGGPFHSLALSQSGKVFAWGSNELGQLGTDADTGFTQSAE